MNNRDVPDDIYEPFTRRSTRAYRFVAYPIALCAGAALWIWWAGYPLSQRLMTLLPTAWILGSVVAIDVSMAWWRRRARRIFVEGQTLRAVIVRKAHKLLVHRGLYPLELEYVLGGRRYTGKAYVPFPFYVRCEVGSPLLVRVLPSNPSLCVPVFEEQAAGPQPGMA